MSLLIAIALTVPAMHRMDGQGAGTGCSTLSTTDVAKLMHVDPGTVRAETSSPEAGHERCVFKSMERVVGAADATAAELAIDHYQLASPERAHAQAAHLGAPALVVKTPATHTGDDAYALAEQVGLDVNREPGFAVVHGSNVVVVQMSGTFMADRPADWAYNMQSVGLRLAGAQVQGPLFPDACDVVPRAQLQTLVTLQPATLVAKQTGSMTQCSLQVQGPDGTRTDGTISIEIRRYRSPESIASDRQEGTAGLLAKGTDPSDSTIVPAGTPGKVFGFHDDTVSVVQVSDADVNAIVSKSYAYRLQRAALQAAGATVEPAPQYGPEPVPQAPAPPAPPTLLSGLNNWWQHTHVVFWLPWVFIGLIFVGAALSKRRR